MSSTPGSTVPGYGIVFQHESQRKHVVDSHHSPVCYVHGHVDTGPHHCVGWRRCGYSADCGPKGHICGERLESEEANSIRSLESVAWETCGRKGVKREDLCNAYEMSE